MKMIYTHHNPMLVSIVKGLLENEGIRVTLKNDFSVGAAGELAPTDLWPELWLETNRHLERAQTIVAQFNDSNSGQMWQCERCGEQNADSFELCWKCDAVKPELVG